MVKVWAEKEFRNLSRLRSAGIRSPEPVQLRMHVLAMEFVGTDGVAAPRLKACPTTSYFERVSLWQRAGCSTLPRDGRDAMLGSVIAHWVGQD